MAALLFTANVSAQTAAPPLPAVTSGTLQLWLEADAGVVTNASGQVLQWQDQSGNANHASQLTANYQPMLVYPSGLGGRAAVRFDGSQGNLNYLAGAGDVGVPNAMTTFTVVNVFTARTNGSSGKNYVDMVWLIGVPPTYGGCRSETDYQTERTFTTWAYGYNAPFVVPTNTYRIWSDRIDTNLTALELYDTTASSSTNFTAPMPTAYTPGAGYYIGGIDPSLPYTTNWNLNGDVAEWIVYKGSLSEADRLAVLNYLQQKYYSSGTGQAPFTNSLVAYYPFNGNANDATGNGNNGQIVGNVVPSTDRFGNPSGAYAFDGVSSSAIEVTNTLFNIGQEGYTISGWFASSNVNLGTVQEIIQTMPQAGIGIALSPPSAPDLHFGVGPTGSWTEDDIYGNQPCANQTWYQFALTKSGTSYTLYLNGQFSCQQSISAAAGYDANVGCIIGSITPINPSYHETFMGRLDDFRIYNRALSSNEVQELYAYESVPQTQPCVPYPATATATVVNGFVVGATVTDGGCGYTNVPLVSFTGGGGSGATATAIVSNGVVVGLEITSPGSGYSSTPTVAINPPFAQTTAPSLPAVTSGTLQLWLKADAGVVANASGQVSQWQDQSGNGNHAYQANANKQPTLVYPAGLSGQAALEFNGVEDGIHGEYLQGTGQVAVPNAMTAFAVYNLFSVVNDFSSVWAVGVPGRYGASRGETIFGGPSGDGRLDFTTWAYDYETPWIMPTNTYRVCTDRVNANLSMVDIFDTSASGETNMSFPMSGALTPAAGYTVGGLNFVSPDNLNGQVAELLIYSGYLSEADRLAVLAYLRQKYYSSAPGQEQAPFTNSLVAYYPFNGNANDASGNGNNGTLFGATAFGVDRFGNGNACLSLPGTQGNGSGVHVPSLTSMPYAPVTYSAWFWLNNYPPPPVSGPNALMNLVGREQCGDQTDGTVCVYSDPSTGQSNNLAYFTGATGYATRSLPPTNQWCQVVMTIDQTGEANIYLDGTNVSGYGQAPAGGPADFRIGASAGVACGYQYVWDGLIDDVRVYNRVLSAQEVQELYTYESVPASPPPQEQAPFANSLVAYYPFNGNANDATGHGNNGQIIGQIVPATDRFGNPNSAYHFNGDGSSSAIEVTNTLFNIGQPGYTVSGWFASDDISRVLQILWNSIPETGIGLAFNDGNRPPYAEFAVGPAMPGIWTVTDIHGNKTDYVNQRWYQTVLTKSGTTYTLYIDGQFECQQTIPAAAEYNDNVGFIIGSITPINPPYPDTFFGRLDDFRVYNRALSSNEVQELYAYESVPQTQPCVPYAATATATVVNGFVVGATVTDGGCGYTNAPVVSFIGGGGSGAAASAVLSNGVVVSITITDAGSGYTTTPAVEFGASITPSSGVIAEVAPVFSNLSVGATYQLQVSSGVSPWIDYDSPFVATNSTITYPQSFSVTNCDQLLFRLLGPPATSEPTNPSDGLKRPKAGGRSLTTPPQGL
jgi:hypothetical protein